MKRHALTESVRPNGKVRGSALDKAIRLLVSLAMALALVPLQAVTALADDPILTVTAADGSIAEEGEIQVDGAYSRCTIKITVTAPGLAETPYPRVQLKRYEIGNQFVSTIDEFQLTSETWFIDASGIGHAAVRAVNPGVYTKAYVLGATTADSTDASGEADLDTPVVIAGTPEVDSIKLKDADGNTLKDAESHDIDLATTTTRLVKDASSIEVSITAAALNVDADIAASQSKALLLDASGAEVSRATFKVADASDHSYVAVLDHKGDDLSTELPEGTYVVKVVAVDRFGNALKDGDDEFVLFGGKMVDDETAGRKLELENPITIDRSDPEVVVTLPSPTGTIVTASGETTYLYSDRARVDVEVHDQSLNPDKSTVFGVPFNDALTDPETAVPGVTFEGVQFAASKDEDGRWVSKLTAHLSDGTYDTPLVSAIDFTRDENGHEVHNVVNDDLKSAQNITHIVVDEQAPEVVEAVIAADAAASLAEGDNAIRFYKSSGDDDSNAALTLFVKEMHGIRSVELTDPLGHYTLSDTVNTVIRSASSTMYEASHTGEYELKIIETLDDEHDFSKGLAVTITDYAGNECVWTLAGGTKRDASTEHTDTPTGTPALSEVLRESEGGTALVPTPTLLIEDDVKPVVSLKGPETDPESGRFFGQGQEVSLEVVEVNLKYLRGFTGGTEGDDNNLVSGNLSGLDPSRVVATVTYEPYSYVTDEQKASVPATITVADLEPDESRPGQRYTYAHTFEADGVYTITAQITDVAGNVSNEASIEQFVVDATPPVITVDWDPADDASVNYGYFNSTRTANITVTEHNFDPAQFEVAVSAVKEKMPSSYVDIVYDASAWTDVDADEHVYTLNFDTDGPYSVRVTGQDKAGNAAEYDGDPLGYYSDTFVIDTETPVIAKYVTKGDSYSESDLVVKMEDPTRVYGGIGFYNKSIELDAQVKDRNLSTAQTKVNGASVSWSDGERDGEGYVTHSLQNKLTFTADGEYETPKIDAIDMANNTSDNAADIRKFILDFEAPTVKVTSSNGPVKQGTSGSSDPYNFYNQSTTLTITVSDAHALYSVQVDDPDNIYDLSSSGWDKNPLGEKQVTGTITLKDNASTAKGEYERNIILTAEDIAGNKRTWSIDHNGTVTQSEGPSAANASINDNGEHPVMLVQDTTNPVVGLSGVEAGKFYNTPQTVVATVNEFNLDYLQMFDGGRAIVTVTKYEANAGRAMSSWTISASAFSGSKPNYSNSIPFDTDGHYVVTAQFKDFAENPSNEVTIGEFTIDTTPPQLTLEFDNNDVRNDKYYKATRTATITVIEHNFDPSLFTIETTGSIGGWADNGDTHTCTVFFDEGGPYTLRVNGQDLAGNEATEVSESEFIVDLTAPEVTIAGTAQRLGYVDDSAKLVGAYHDKLEDRSAYNGVVVPVITYTDNEELVADDLSYALSGSKHGEDMESESTVSEAGKEMTITLRDFGYTGDGAGDGSNWEDFYVDDYDVDADDIYTIKASMTDQAGNEAEAELVFSVNRYGSNYDVAMAGMSAEERAEYYRSGMLSEAPTIVVREISVSGVADHDDDGNIVPDNHHVEKEFANATTAIALQPGKGAGYGLKILGAKDATNGWNEYVYTVRSANFGEGSDSDHNDRGQGVYRVNVMSDDTSSNANTTADYWSSDKRRTKVEATGATAEFILDEMAPAIDDVDLPNHLSVGKTYEASFHVTDDITSGDIVEVVVDGKTLEAGQVHGPRSGVGTFTFDIEGKPFNWNRSVKIVVRDYAGREASAGNGSWIWQSSFIPEGLALVGVLAVLAVTAAAIRRRRLAAEPDLPR